MKSKYVFPFVPDSRVGFDRAAARLLDAKLPVVRDGLASEPLMNLWGENSRCASGSGLGAEVPNYFFYVHVGASHYAEITALSTPF